MVEVVSGAITMGSLIIALFFLRFWRDTRDRFFLYFALSFIIEGLHRVYVITAAVQDEAMPLHYLVRLAAYLLILWAIVEKNWPSARNRD
jgi:hypothetical protein